MSEPIEYAFTNTGVFSSHDGINFTVNATANVTAAALGNSVFVTSNLIMVGNSTVFNTLNSTAWTGTANSGAATSAFYGNSTVNASINSTFVTISTTTSNSQINSTVIFIGNSTVNNSINSTAFSGTSNNTLFVGSVSSANVVSNTQLQANLANYAPINALSYNNIIINGGMEVSQFNGTTGVTVAATYQLDQWLVAKSGTMVCTAQQVADAPPGYTNSLKVTVGTAQGSLGVGDYTFIFQQIEGFRTSKLGFGLSTAQSCTLGFWTKIHRTGAYSGSIRNGVGNRSYPFSFTQNVADTWEYKTVIFPGDITGTWVGNTNATSFSISFSMAAGTTFTGPVNTWAASNYLGVTGTTNGVAATSDTFQITGVTLLPGSLIIPSTMSPNFIRSYDDEFKICTRHYLVYGNGIALNQHMNGGMAFSTTIFRTVFVFPEMRIAPTASLSAVTDFGVDDTVVTPVGASAAFTTSLGELTLQLNVASGLTAARAGFLYAANTNARIKLDARM